MDQSSTTTEQNSNNNSSDNSNIIKDIFVPGQDPLFSYQWYLINSGNKIFKFSQFTSGVDVDWSADYDYKGEGVQVIVSDGRIQTSHEDIQGNVLDSKCKNYTEGSSDLGANPDTGENDDNHGTFVMGLIGAVENNSKGVIGVAPKVNLVGYNYLNSNQGSSITLDNYEADTTSIFNYSYGFFNCELTPDGAGEKEQVRKQSNNGHVYLTAAGNDFYSSQDACEGDSEIFYLGNSNFNQFKTYPEMIVVAAVDGKGLPTMYTTPGSNIFVSAPGGDSGSPMIGLDLEGCSIGQATSNSSLAFDSGKDVKNTNCNYVMDSMMGTSFATPLAVGAVAVIRELCPTCNWREIRYVLAKTSSVQEGMVWNYEHPLGLDLSGVEYHSGFVENAAGFLFNNDLGFGEVSVKNIIDFLSLNEVNLYDKRSTVDKDRNTIYKTGSLNLAIPDNNATGVSSVINVDSHDLTIEHILVTLTIDHSYFSDLGVDLTSPDGTTHRLLNYNSEILMTGNNTIKLGVNGFFGETSKGNWTLKVFDALDNDTGSLKSWSIGFVGSKWGRDLESTPNPVNNLTHDGNNFSWSDPNAETLRFEYCVRSAGQSCQDDDWLSIEKNTTNITVSSFATETYHNIISGLDYTFHVRVISNNEEDSAIESISWTAP